jgi:drug/metabolite transporter (DMT)-like permease
MADSSPHVHSKFGSGVVALAILAAIYGLTAVMSRYFSGETSLFEQWYLRLGLAALLTAIIFYRKIDFKKFTHLSRRELGLVMFRGIVGSVLATGLYALASQQEKIGVVSLMQILPLTAVFGMLLMHEKLTLRRALLLAISFVGAIVVMVPKLSSGASLGSGALLSLISGALFALVFVLRKKQTGELNNYELAFGTLVVGAVGNYLLSVGVYHRAFVDVTQWSPMLGVLFLGAGFLSALMSLLSSYGFEHVPAITASIILDLELVFGIVFGFLIYREVLSGYEIVGASIILAAIVIMSYTENSKRAYIVPAPVD